jgi:hypothetical protein
MEILKMNSVKNSKLTNADHRKALAGLRDKFPGMWNAQMAARLSELLQHKASQDQIDAGLSELHPSQSIIPYGLIEHEEVIMLVNKLSHAYKVATASVK